MFGGNTSLDVTAMKMIAFNIYLPILSLHFQKKTRVNKFISLMANPLIFNLTQLL